MKIAHKLRDYYDFAGHLYGEPDQTLWYHRGKFKEGEQCRKSQYGDTYVVNIPHRVESFPWFNIGRNTFGPTTRQGGRLYNFLLIVVNGKGYILLQRNTSTPNELPYGYDHTTELFLPQEEFLLAEEWTGLKYPTRGYRVDNTLNNVDPALLFGIENPVFDEIAKIVDQPVFEVTGFTHQSGKTGVEVRVDGKVPMLKDIHGFAKRFDAFQLYQSIEHYLANVLRTNPDTAPPVQVSDKDRIIQHGFDIKQSFRHRPND